MQLAEKNHGVTMESTKEAYDKKFDRLPYCDLELSDEHEASDYAQIEPKNCKWYSTAFFGLCILIIPIPYTPLSLSF